jgi:hypothetical protein
MECPNKDVDWCHDGVTAKCAECPAYTRPTGAECPAYTWRVRLAWWWKRLLALFLGVLLVFAVTPGTAMAAHNPAHDCPAQVAQAVLAGLMGGHFVGNEMVQEWTDGRYVCVFYGGAAKTLFRSRNAEQIIARDVVRKGLAPLSQSTAQKLVSAGKKLAGASGSGLAFPFAGWTYCGMWPENCRQPEMW